MHEAKPSMIVQDDEILEPELAPLRYFLEIPISEGCKNKHLLGWCKAIFVANQPTRTPVQVDPTD